MTNAKDKSRSITLNQAEAISACMDGTVSVYTVLNVVRGFIVSKSPETVSRNNEIFSHYEHILAIERRHRDDCDEEIREYVKAAQKANKSQKHNNI